ncbi:MAG: hypothetical protein HRT68_12985 [Flavobacteriaceae bacterium]|nr:hypothetical protein [Flavobacteriaceae bacterium]
MKPFIYLSILFVLISCKKDYKVTHGANLNSDLIKQIDVIPEVVTWYKIKLDSLQNPTDTISVEKQKHNAEGNIVYSEITAFYPDVNFKTEEYYRNNGNLFQSKSWHGDQLNTFTEVLEKNGRDHKMTTIHYQEGKAMDTAFNSYEYTLNAEGKLEKSLKKMLWKGEILYKYHIDYNETESPISEIVTSKENTVLSKTLYSYKNNILERETITNTEQSFEPGHLVKIYNAEGKLFSEKSFEKKSDSLPDLIPVSLTIYDVNKAGETIKETTTNWANGAKKVFIYTKN